MNVSNRESIRHFTEKLKSFLVDQMTLFGLVIIAVGVISFCLGRLSMADNCQLANNDKDRILLCPDIVTPAQPNPITEPLITPTGTVEGVTTSLPNANFLYVASKNGTKYHHVTCPGAKQIKDTNKLFFSSVTEAESAGYSRAANCNK